MCGISGIVGPRGSTVDPQTLAALGRALAHRGPDGSGEYRHGNVGFRHERLAIIDLDTGDQPLHDAAGRALVVNGEIYNYIELKAAMPEVAWRTRSDCEPLLALYERHGLGFVDHARGMYALALHDPARGRVVLARDPFGIKPLYYAATPEGLAFASEPQAIVAALAAMSAKASSAPRPDARAGLPPDARAGLRHNGLAGLRHNGLAGLRPEAAFELLQLQFTTGRETIFEGVLRLLPGEVLAVEDGIVVERRTGPEVLPRIVRRPREAEALRAADAVIAEAVTLHQRSDVPYGLFLSSGIDSSVLLTAMRRLNAAPVRTYTAAFPETGVHDEREAAAAMARAAGARHTEVPVTPETFFRRLPEIAAALDDPVADYAIVPTFLLAERAAQDVKVVLSGVGGDELFAGYSRYRRQMLPRWLGGRPRRAKGPCDGLDLFRTPVSGWRDGIAAAEAAAAAEPFNALQRAQAIDFVDWLPHSVLVGLDRCLMHFGLEGRTPLLDRGVAAFGFPLRNGLKLRRGKGKYLLRRWLAEHNTAARPFARKLGFTVPVGEWIAREGTRLGPLVARDPGIAALCRPEVVTRVFADPGKAQRLLAWRLLFLALWHRRHIRGLHPAGDTLECLETP